VPSTPPSPWGAHFDRGALGPAQSQVTLADRDSYMLLDSIAQSGDRPTVRPPLLPAIRRTQIRYIATHIQSCRFTLLSFSRLSSCAALVISRIVIFFAIVALALTLFLTSLCRTGLPQSQMSSNENSVSEFDKNVRESLRNTVWSPSRSLSSLNPILCTQAHLSEAHIPTLLSTQCD